MAKKERNPNTCPACPNAFAPTGCPCWIGPEAGFMETNIATGEERLVTGCFYQIIPKLMVHVVKASNRPAAVMESLRNNVHAGFQMLAARIVPPTVVIPAVEPEQISHGEKS